MGARLMTGEEITFLSQHDGQVFADILGGVIGEDLGRRPLFSFEGDFRIRPYRWPGPSTLWSCAAGPWTV